MKLTTLTLSLLFLAIPAISAAADPQPIYWANKMFSGSAEAPPPVILHDFGTLPKGTIKSYRFKMANIYAYPMEIKSVPAPDCGCVSVIEYTGKMNPRETGHIDIMIDTRRVDGEKAVRVPVRFDGRDPKTKDPFYSTAILEIRAISRADISVNPGEIAFGQVPAGQKASQSVIVTYTGLQPNWKITEVGIRKELFDADVKAVNVRGAKAAYQVTLNLKAGAPAGRVDEFVELKTNEPGAATVLSLSVSGIVQSPLTIVGGVDVIKMNGVEVSKKEERRVAIAAEKPFKVTEVEGQGDGVSVTLLPVPANKNQVIVVTFAPEIPGPVKKVLTIKTDTGKSVSLTVEAIGKDAQ